jgi:hypothetical protein
MHRDNFLFAKNMGGPWPSFASKKLRQCCIAYQLQTVPKANICNLCLFCQLGVFEMSESGLQAVLNPSEMFLTEHASDSEILAGLAVAVVLDGSRTFAIEVQVLQSTYDNHSLV